MKILSLDYGEKRIGAAIGLSGVINTLPVITGTELESIKKIQDVCVEEKINLVLLGISEGKTAQKTKKFAQKLSGIVKLPVELVDETLTTWEAKEIISSQGERVKKPVDSISAALILERFLLLKRKEVVNV